MRARLLQPRTRGRHDVSRELAELQETFQRHLLTGDTAFAGEVSAHGAAIDARLAVYATAYQLRLIEALAANFPQLRELVGSEPFGALAREYLDRYPSRHPSVRWFGHQLGAHLLSQPQHADHPWLAEFAVWEWQLGLAFDAADAVPMTASSLSLVSADAWPGLRFEFHPSMRCLTLHTNVVEMYKALSAQLQPPAPQVMQRSETWLIWRRETTTHFRSCADDEAHALRVVADHGNFAAMCDALCEWLDETAVPARAASLLKTWMNEELIVACRPD